MVFYIAALLFWIILIPTTCGTVHYLKVVLLFVTFCYFMLRLYLLHICILHLSYNLQNKMLHSEHFTNKIHYC